MLQKEVLWGIVSKEFCQQIVQTLLTVIRKKPYVGKISSETSGF